MTHRLYCRSTHQPIDSMPMHVLAYAYRNAWLLLNGSEPRGPHTVESLDLLIDFYGMDTGASK